MPRRKSDSKPRGRVTSYAFFMQTSREEYKKKHPDENVIFVEFSKMCAQKWKSLSTEEKKPFVEMAERDKARYNLEMVSYQQAGGTGTTKKKVVKEKKLTNKANGRDAYFWFSYDQRQQIKETNPYLKSAEIRNQVEMSWAYLDPETKQKYEAIAQRGRARGLNQPVTVVDCGLKPCSYYY